MQHRWDQATHPHVVRTTGRMPSSQLPCTTSIAGVRALGTPGQGCPLYHRSWPTGQTALPRSRRIVNLRRGPRLCRSGEQELADLLLASQNAAAGDADGEDSEDEDVDELVELGFSKKLTARTEKYRAQITEKLREEKERAAREEKARSRYFVIGKYAYERGQYQKAVEALETALDREGPFSQLGGDIQLWLALAYNACGREEECISVYRRMEVNHPSPKMRRQAEHLRFILEAPKLQRSPDEKVKIPILKDVERKSGRPSYARMQTISKERPLTLEERFLAEYKPPKWVTNRYVWVAATILGSGLALYSLTL